MTKGKVLAIIPARGGSKGIPRKNLTHLGGLPLIAWSILAAKSAQSVAKVIVSTEDQEIADVAKSFGAEVPFLRPESLATDSANVADAVKHLKDVLKERGEEYETTLVLFPTHPFRTPALLDEMAELAACGALSVSTASVFKFNPKFWLGVDRGVACALSGSSPGIACRRFQLAGLYREPNESLPISESLFRDLIPKIAVQDFVLSLCKVSKHAFPGFRIAPVTHAAMLVDIDTPEDLAHAEQLVSRNSVPWIPNKGYTGHEAPVTSEHTLRQPVTVLEVLPKGRIETLVPSYDLDKLDKAVVLREHLNDVLPECRGKKIIVHKTSLPPATKSLAQNRAMSSSEPLISYFPAYRLPAGIANPFHVVGFTGDLKFDRLPLSDILTRMNGWLPVISVEVQKQELAITLPVTPQAPQANDRLCLRFYTSTGEAAYKDSEFIYDGKNWSCGESHFQGKGAKLRGPLAKNIYRGHIQWLRPGLGAMSEPVVTMPIEIAGWMKHTPKKGWINKRDEKVIVGRQDLAPIYEWAGWLSLPPKVTSKHYWHPIEERSLRNGIGF